MNYIFFGTPRFAEIVLEKLIQAGTPPTLVVCNPDRPTGRKKNMTPPLTKVLAEKNHIPVLQPEKLDEEFVRQLSVSGAEVAIVVAYGKIIPEEVLHIPARGIIGVHPSLLPKYRGASPIQSAMLNGEKETGVTLYIVDEKVDNGPILVKRELNVELQMLNYENAEKKLAELGAELLIETLAKYIKGEIKPQPQDESLATLTKKFVSLDGFVDLQKDDPKLIARKIRALNPDPGVYTMQNGQPNGEAGKRLKLLEVKEEDGGVIITKTQMEGKRPQTNNIALQ